MKSFVKISLCFLFATLILLGFSACTTNGDVTLIAESFEYEKGIFKLTVGCEVESFCLNDYISVADSSEWKIYKDKTLKQEILEKTVTLKEGTNIFFVHVFCSNAQTTYPFEIYKKRICQVQFSGTASDILVEEGSFIDCPAVFPTKTGYIFAGWNFDFTESISSDTVIDALWQAKTYIICLDAEGGQVESDTIEIAFDSPLVLLLPVKHGYSFDGWYNDEIKQENEIWKKDEDMFLTAHWQPIYYQILYNLVGGTNNTANPSFFNIEDNINLQPPTRIGYEFDGWTAKGQTLPTKEVAIKNETGEKNFTAHWTPKSYEITLDCMGGECKFDTISVTFGKENKLPETSKRGYEFIGWFLGKEEICSESLWTIAEDVILKANWEVIIYQITYELYGGENDPNNPNTYTIEDETIVLLPATKKGNIFCGWQQQKNDNDIVSYIENIEHGSVGDVTLAAHFEAGTEGLEFTAVKDYNKVIIYYEVINYTGQAKEVVIPEKYMDLPVKAIKSGSFLNSAHVLTLTIPTSVEKIEEGALSGCCSLKEIVLPFVGSMRGNSSTQSCLFGWIFGNKCMENSSQTISRYNNNSSYTFYIPNSLKKVTVTNENQIGQNAFENCTFITEICLNEEVFNIGSYAFSGCASLTTLNIPINSNIKEIGNGAFKDCTALAFLYLPDKLEHLGANVFENWTSSQTISLHADVFDATSFNACQATLVYREKP